MEYLSALGATDAADPDAVQVPGITSEQLEMLLTSDPMYSRPALDRLVRGPDHTRVYGWQQA